MYYGTHMQATYYVNTLYMVQLVLQQWRYLYLLLTEQLCCRYAVAVLKE